MLLWFDSPGFGHIRAVPIHELSSKVRAQIARVKSLEMGAWFVILVGDVLLLTPKKKPVIAPTIPLAERLCYELIHLGPRKVGSLINDGGLLTLQLVITAQDLVAGEEERTARDLIDMVPLDMLLFRSAVPDLQKWQDYLWTPILKWAEHRFETQLPVSKSFQLPSGETTNRFRSYLLTLDALTLMGLSHLTSLSGSLILAMAVHHRAISVEDAYTAHSVEEIYQHQSDYSCEEATPSGSTSLSFVSSPTKGTKVPPQTPSPRMCRHNGNSSNEFYREFLGTCAFLKML